MALKNVKNQVDTLFRKINASLAVAAKNPAQMTALAEFAIQLIVKRTRLGFGVTESLGTRSPLKRLSTRYVKQRKMFSALDTTTRPQKSNLTLTGQLLRSMQITARKSGAIYIGPSGQRDDGKSNRKIAEYQMAQGRTFNRLSLNEYNQIVRYYRKSFGDLLRKRSLLR